LQAARLPLQPEMNRGRKARRRLSYEGKITWLTFVAVAPAVIVALALLWFGDHPPKVQWTLTILIVGCMAAFVWSTREHAVRPLQTLSNLLAALREGDYSIRARGAREGTALGEVLLEVNSLGETLRQQRLGAFEATAQFLRLIPNDVSALSIAPVRLCWDDRWTSC
jgi:two-component system, NtrC family, nitrogen regulation sensor histidine kinase NtrY